MKFSVEIKDEKIQYEYEVGESTYNGIEKLSVDSYITFSECLRVLDRYQSNRINRFKDEAISEAIRGKEYSKPRDED